MRSREPIRHGTFGGYRTHFRHGVPLCGPCRQANREWYGRLPQRSAECGTSSGYTHHRRLGEPACEDCLAAHARDTDARARARRGDAWPYEQLIPSVAELDAHGWTTSQIAAWLQVSELRVNRARSRAQRGAA